MTTQWRIAGHYFILSLADGFDIELDMERRVVRKFLKSFVHNSPGLLTYYYNGVLTINHIDDIIEVLWRGYENEKLLYTMNIGRQRDTVAAAVRAYYQL